MVDEANGSQAKPQDHSADAVPIRGSVHARASPSEKAAIWVTGILVALLIVSLLILAFHPKNATDAPHAFVAVLVALFSVLVTGVFVFATFRIDRGAKLEAYQTAREVAISVAQEIGTRGVNESKTAARQEARKIAQEMVENAQKKAQEAATEITNKAARDSVSIARTTAQDAATRTAQETAKSTARSIAKRAVGSSRQIARTAAQDVAARTARRVADERASAVAASTAHRVAARRLSEISDHISRTFQHLGAQVGATPPLDDEQ